MYFETRHLLSLRQRVLDRLDDEDGPQRIVVVSVLTVRLAAHLGQVALRHRGEWRQRAFVLQRSVFVCVRFCSGSALVVLRARHSNLRRV